MISALRARISERDDLKRVLKAIDPRKNGIHFHLSGRSAGIPYAFANRVIPILGSVWRGDN